MARWLCLVAVFAVAGRTEAQPVPAGLVTGAPTTQRLTFAAGPNQVSLSVYPANHTIEAIFGAQLPRVLLVKNAAGAVHSTRYGVRELTEWPWNESVSVYAREPFSIDVSGPRIEPWSQIPLMTGWSWVPSLVAAPTPVADALASIAASLSRIEDGAGRAYPARPGEPVLTTLEPGAGYRLRLTVPATLAYAAGPPTVPPPGGPPQTEVPTVLDAIALTGLEPGQEVAVRGFRTDGDGGAGRLRVTTSGCTPDGGTCFVPTEHTAAGEPYSSDWGFSLYGDDLQWESFRLCHSQASAPQNATRVTGDGCFDALQLHGHGAGAGGDKLFDPSTGRVEITGAMNTYARQYDGSPSQTAVFRYSTNTIRLERIVEPMTLEGRATTDYTRPEWWGAQPLLPQATSVRFDDRLYDATDAVAWAIEAASEHAASVNRDQYVVLSGMYGYSGTIELRNRVALKGANDGAADGTGLRVLAGTAWHSYTTSYLAQRRQPSNFLEPRNERDALLKNGERWFLVRQGLTSTDTRTVDIELDGNLDGNDYVFSPQYVAAAGPSDGPWPSAIHEWYRNTANWTGVATSQDMRDTPEGRLRLINVHIHNFGSSGILGNDVTHFGGSERVRVGNSLNNHLVYGAATAPGEAIRDLTLYGFAYGTMMDLYTGHIDGLTVNVTTLNNPLGLDFSGVINPRYNPWEIERMERGEPYVPFHEYGDRVEIDRMTVNFSLPVPNSKFFNLFSQTGGHVDIRNLAVNGDAGSAHIFYYTPWYVHGDRPTTYRLEGFRATRGGILSSGLSPVSDVRDVVVERPGAQTATFDIRPGIVPRVVNVATAYDVDTGGLTGPDRPYVAVKVWPLEAATGFRFFAARSRLAYLWNTPLQVNLNNIGWTAEEARARIQLYFRETQLTEVSPEHVAEGYSYFDRVTTANLRTSEDRGALTVSPLASGSYVDVPTTLFAAPADPSFVVVSGPDAGRFLGWTNVGTAHEPVLRLRFSGTGSVNASWTAAVRPIPDSVVFPE